MSQETKTLTLKSQRGSKKVYSVQSAPRKVAAGGSDTAFDDIMDRETAQSRASRLGVKLHSRGKRTNRSTNRQPNAIADDNIGNNNVMGMPQNDYFGNTHPANDDIDGNAIDDAAALAKANALSVQDQNPFYRDNDAPYSPNQSQFADEEPRKERKRGTGFLGRNKNRSRNQSRRSDHAYA